MSIEEAVSKGELVPIRCVRVKTNVDLTRVRFNQIQYNAHDLENAVFIPSRDQLIVETWLRHVKDRRTVVFCISVHHGERLAARFRDSGVSANQFRDAIQTRSGGTFSDNLSEVPSMSYVRVTF